MLLLLDNQHLHKRDANMADTAVRRGDSANVDPPPGGCDGGRPPLISPSRFKCSRLSLRPLSGVFAFETLDLLKLRPHAPPPAAASPLLPDWFWLITPNLG